MDTQLNKRQAFSNAQLQIQEKALSHTDSLHHRHILIIVLLVVITTLSTAATIFLLYQAAFTREKALLEEMVQSQAHLIDAVSRFDALYSIDDHPKGASAALFRHSSVVL